ncbi:MAG: hypothetical protein LBV12_00265, partial [Puniceicoccales bacterium]|nr:hypothetical protein [Puniceicoccales bacterium]
MKIVNILVVLIAVLAWPLAVFATAQFSETLNYEGRDVELLEVPLEAYLGTLKEPPTFSQGLMCTACYRGY